MQGRGTQGRGMQGRGTQGRGASIIELEARVEDYNQERIGDTRVYSVLAVTTSSSSHVGLRADLTLQ